MVTSFRPLINFSAKQSLFTELRDHRKIHGEVPTRGERPTAARKNLQITACADVVATISALHNGSGNLRAASLGEVFFTPTI